MIKRNNEVENDIINRIQNTWNAKKYERTGFALYEILHPRKAYFDRIMPKPPTIEDICYFISGKSIERGFTDSLGLSHGRKRNKLGINYSVDVRCPEYPIIEIKSRRWNLPKEDENLEDAFAHYLNQVRAYMALDNICNATLVVVSLNEKIDDSWKTRPVIAAYDVSYDYSELKQTRKNLKFNKKILQLVLEDKVPYTELPKCEDWMCGRQIKTMVSPPVCKTCKAPKQPNGVGIVSPEGYRTFSTDYLLKRHVEGKSGQGHEVEYGTYEWSFEPTCKYFNECKPVELPGT